MKKLFIDYDTNVHTQGVENFVLCKKIQEIRYEVTEK